jgi:carbon monoxide dehydrogenase subunit G
VILHDAPPIRLGSRYTEIAIIAGRELKTTYEVIDMEPPKKVRVRTVKSVFPIGVLLQLEEEAEGTRVSINLDFTLKGVYKLAAPVVQGIVRQQARDILRRLKKITENN